MSTYGFELWVTRKGFEGATIVRKEVEASDARAARAMIDAWAAMEEARVEKADLLADGCTFREAGKRNAMSIAGHVSLEFGAVVEGPYDATGGPVVVRVTLPNGSGVSLATDGPLAYDPAPHLEAVAFVSDGNGGADWHKEPVRRADLDAVREMLRELSN